MRVDIRKAEMNILKTPGLDMHDWSRYAHITVQVATYRSRHSHVINLLRGCKRTQGVKRKTVLGLVLELKYLMCEIMSQFTAMANMTRFRLVIRYIYHSLYNLS
jgi:hypothetical protein